MYILNYCHKYVCVVIVHCSGEDLVQLDLGMTIKYENLEQLEENKRGDIRKKEVKMLLFLFCKCFRCN